jgi:hypothetical protein
MSTSILSIADERTEVAATPSVRIAWSENAPVIDGRLDDTVWQGATRIDPFVQVNPVQGAAPTQRTDVRLLTDGRTLFQLVCPIPHRPKAQAAPRAMEAWTLAHANLPSRHSLLREWREGEIVCDTD